MLLRMTFALPLVASFALASPVRADPITYDFTGTLQQTVNGSRTFNGSLTINATPFTPTGQSDIT
ncbi:MAG: hypothetical protein ACYC61_09070 [Isosphaeraceae bacterium]